jgi:hypothetical protein
MFNDLQTLIKHSFILYFPRELLMNFLKNDTRTLKKKALWERLDYKIFYGCMPLELFHSLSHLSRLLIYQDENISFLQAFDYQTTLS